MDPAPHGPVWNTEDHATLPKELREPTHIALHQLAGQTPNLGHGSDHRMFGGWVVFFLFGGFNPSEKYERQLGRLFPMYGKIKMFQNTNQFAFRPTGSYISHDNQGYIRVITYVVTEEEAMHIG